jgi:hypothetical protein
MSKIIKYNDYIQINPDERILALDKSEKVILTDSLLTRAYTQGKGLLVTYDLSHSGRKINNRVYSTRGQQRGIESLTSPYPKPILKNHDQHSEPVGRFVAGEWQETADGLDSFFSSQDSYIDFRNAFIEDNPKKIYQSLKKNDLLNNKKWPGLGRMRVQANITDEDAIKKFLDGRYLTFSAGSTTNRHVCSICENDWATDGICEHRHGEQYDGETCVFITGDFIVLEGSIVNTPADDLSQVLAMEITDSLDESQSFKRDNLQEIILTDSLYNLGDENGLQANQECTNGSTQEKEEDAKKEVKKYDHDMSLSSEQMMELHESGETYVLQRDGSETMTIKVMFPDYESMKRGKESEEEDSIMALEEFFTDEKTFKVPSGAKGNAQKVLDWKEKYGSEVRGMTPVGWARARQLASKSEIGLSTVRRMAAFNRHRSNAAVAPEYKSEPWKDRGYVAWLGWGGTSGIDWAVRVSAANRDSAIGDFDLDAERSSPAGKGAKTPAKPSERIKGSKVNAEGSASKASSKIEVGSVLNSLKEKVSSHNEKYGKDKGKKVTLGMLKAVYRRGAGAFSATHRPGMSRSGWGVARVNAFLKLVRSGAPSNPKYTTDNDLLPAGHPRKSSTKKEAPMKKDNENLEEEIITSDDNDLLEASEEISEDEQTKFENEFVDETDIVDDEDVDWEILDLALQAAAIQLDAELSTEKRNSLPESSFCGPDRSFPIPDCAHVTAAKRLIGRSKYSESTKSKIMACVNKKATRMSCESSDEVEVSIETRFNELQAKYDSLADQFKELLSKFIEKNSNDEKVVDISDKVVVNDIEMTEEKVFNNIIDKKVSNPSNHAEEEKVISEDTNVIVMKPLDDKLGAYERKVMESYRSISIKDGEDVADSWFATQAKYLPRGFNPKNF